LASDVILEHGDGASMSVLVEALSLIIPRTVLDVSYPGGTDAFMRKMCEPDIPERRACADAKLVSVSFLGAAEARAVGLELLELGIVGADDDRFQEFAFIDQTDGPTLRCDWLEWRRDPDGFMYCWLAGSEPGDLHAPEKWTAKQSRALARQDIREQPGRCLRLAVEKEGEVWLDFQTGSIIEGAPPRTAEPFASERERPTNELEEDVPNVVVGDPTVPSALIEVVAASLEKHGHQYFRINACTIQLSLRHAKAAYLLSFTANDYLGLVELIVNFSPTIPDERRAPIAELASRMNVLLRVGNFELDFTSGVLRFRATSHVPYGAPTEDMVWHLVTLALHMLDQHHDAIMRVAFADVSPAEAL
jgi:hypothetical protein